VGYDNHGNPGGALRDFEFYYSSSGIYVFVFVYGIWEYLAAWKILLQGVAVICLRFWEFSKITQIEKRKQLSPAAGFGPKQYRRFVLPAKAPPR
jgi:hypothetical protein